MNKLAAIISTSLIVTSVNAMAEVYVGGKVGQSWFNDACRATDSCDDDAPAIGLFLGYEFNNYLGIEGGYDYLGDITGAGINDDSVSAVTLAPKFSLPINDQFALYAKVGGAYVNYGTKDDMSYLGAAGIEFHADPNTALRLEYQRLTDINNDTVTAKSNLISLGFVYKFGAAHTVTPEPEAEPIAAPEPQPEPQFEPKPVPKPVQTYKKRLSSSSSFGLNSAVLTSRARSDLQEAITMLKQYPQSYATISGYSDSTGTAEYNKMLSGKRANAVAKYIESKGIESARISTQAMGESHPIASNKTREGRQKNRRVELEIPVFEYQIQVSR